MSRILRSCLAFVLLALVLAAPSAQAADMVAVLDLSGADHSLAQRQTWTDALRAETTKLLPDHNVLSRENMNSRLAQSGQSPKDSAGATRPLDLGRSLGASLVVSGNVRKKGRSIVGLVEVHDVAGARLIGTRRIRERRSNELMSKLGRAVSELLVEFMPPEGFGAEGQPFGGGGAWDLDLPRAHVVRFESDPMGAELRVDGNRVGITPRGIELTEGRHTVAFELPRHELREESISVSEPVVVLGKLTPLFGWISVVTDPPGLEIWIDGQSVGISPIRRYEADPGAHEVQVRDQRYYTGEVAHPRLRGNEHRKIHLTPEPLRGSVRVWAEAVGGDGSNVPLPVVLDGREVGTTPWEGKLIVGTHRLSVAGEFRQVDVAEGRVTYEVFEVQPTGSGQAGAVLAGTNAIGIQMMRIPAGTFRMGSPESEPERVAGEEFHWVVLTRDYLLATTEVSQGQWQSVMGENPSRFEGRDLPVEKVSWFDAVEFCNKLSVREGLEKAYQISEETVTWAPSATGYRLPTEAEWEYACRAGTTTPFHFGTTITSDQVNYDGSTSYVGGPAGENRAKTVAVGSMPANAWGLHEMHGNVNEWCWDWYANYPARTLTDPEGPPSGSGRVLRGGGWSSKAGNCRSAIRPHFVPTQRYVIQGLRVARSVPE